MTIPFHPNAGTILVCDFHGMVKPEMVKTRPVVVISPRRRRHSGLCTVVPLSTTIPDPVMKWHYKMQFAQPLSPDWTETDVWIKCDMIYTVSFERLNRFYKIVGTYRKYCDNQVSEQQLDDIIKCVTNSFCP
jgi:uncharacterized protein YifN (PemK superfamily)